MPELLPVAASPRYFLSGVAVSPRGRIFASLPRRHLADTPSLMEITAEGEFEPYPGDDWNAWRPGLSPEDRIVSAHALYADARNGLWLVDDATPGIGPAVEGAAKLVYMDLDANEVVRVYPIGAEILAPGSLVCHVRVDDLYAYVSEARHGSIIVVDLATGGCLKRLSRDDCTHADPSIVPVVEGRELRDSDGRAPLVHVYALELSADGRWLYFAPLCGPALRRVETRRLRDYTLSDEDIGGHVQAVARIPPVAGLARDAAGNSYLSAFTENAILKLAPDGRIETLVQDSRVCFPAGSSVGPDGCLYFAASQAHRLPEFCGGASHLEPPFQVFKVALG